MPSLPVSVVFEKRDESLEDYFGFAEIFEDVTDGTQKEYTFDQDYSKSTAGAIFEWGKGYFLYPEVIRVGYRTRTSVGVPVTKYYHGIYLRVIVRKRNFNLYERTFNYFESLPVLGAIAANEYAWVRTIIDFNPRVIVPDTEIVFRIRNNTGCTLDQFWMVLAGKRWSR